MKVTFEVPYKKKEILKCKRCQGFGHSKNQCFRLRPFHIYLYFIPFHILYIYLLALKNWIRLQHVRIAKKNTQPATKAVQSTNNIKKNT